MDGATRSKNLYAEVMAKKRKNLLDQYRFPGCRPKAGIKGVFGDSHAVVISLQRVQKKRCAEGAVLPTDLITTRLLDGYGIFPVAMRASIWSQRCAGSTAESA